MRVSQENENMEFLNKLKLFRCCNQDDSDDGVSVLRLLTPSLEENGFNPRFVSELYSLAQYPVDIQKPGLNDLLSQYRRGEFPESTLGNHFHDLTEDLYIIYLMKDDRRYWILAVYDPFELYFDPIVLEYFTAINVDELLQLAIKRVL